MTPERRSRHNGHRHCQWSYKECCYILTIRWRDFVTNTEDRELSQVTVIDAMLLKTQLRWAGHVSRMEDHRLPKTVLAIATEGHLGRDTETL